MIAVRIANTLNECWTQGSAKPMTLNYRLLPRVTRNTPNTALSIVSVLFSGHSPVVLHDIALPKFTQEVLIVRDDNELEVGASLAFVDDAEQVVSVNDWSYRSLNDLLYETGRKSIDILRV